MSMISEQIENLRRIAKEWNPDTPINPVIVTLNQAADTIESLHAKLQAANMERPAETKFNGDLISRNELLRIIDSRIADYRHDCNDGWQKYADWYEYDIRPLVRDFQSINAPSYDCGGWIYCGDGNNLPEESGYYDVTIESKINDEIVRTTECRCFHKDIKFWAESIEPEFAIDETVIAWKNRPEPYHDP